MRLKIILTLLSSVIVVIIGICAWRWQMRKLANAVQSLPAQQSENVMLASMADITLDSSVLNMQQHSIDDKPILDQYKNNRQLMEERSQLVRTWINASSLIKELSPAKIPTGVVTDSAQLTGVSSRFRKDAWSHSFCVFFKGGKAVVMSSGGKNPLACDKLPETANQLARGVITKKMVKTNDNVFAVVQDAPRPTS